jgi:serine/threonine protein kinase
MPQTIADRYRLVTELGRGGMGVVWEAFDELLHRSVAVKEVHYPVGVSGQDRERLAAQTLREARAVAAVDTFAAVRVFDVVEQGGKPWLVMELVRGHTLTDTLRAHGALPPQEVARVGLAVLTALEAAHQAGVLHRDVKPSNVLVGDDGRIALTDFGIATVGGDPGDTATGVIVGSPSYVAPERAQGAPPSPASDLWSLGATLWTAAEGRAPYCGATAFVVLSSVANDDPPPCTHCGDSLRSLLTAMMSRSPESRPTAREIRAELDRIAQAPAPTATQPMSVLEAGFDRTTVLSPDPPAAASFRAAAPAPSATDARPEADAVVDASTGTTRLAPRVGAALLAAAVVGGLVAGGMLLLSRSAQNPSASASHHHRLLVSNPHRAATSPSLTSSTTSAGAVPAGWHRYTDPSLGWSVAVPKGWQRSVQAGGTQFSDPAGGRYVSFGTRYPAGSSAIGAWRSQERAFRSTHSNYQRLQLATVPVAGADDAADWQFTYTEGGVSLHALDRGMVYGTRGYGIYFQTHTDQWASSARMLRTIVSTYQPGRTGA